MATSSNNPLVSCLIITYNSSKYIVDALESVKSQTYENIELVVSDDGSKDDTVAICHDWIASNKCRFVNAVVVTTPVNTGTSANCNRGVRACKGKWLKLFAGDDVLLPTCIEELMAFVSSDKDIQWVVGKSKKYRNSISDECLLDSSKLYSECRLAFLNGDLQIQREAINNLNFIEAVASFVRIDAIVEAGMFNEEYMLLEDWPMYKHLIDNGVKCHFMDRYIVGYRINDGNVFSVTTRLFNMLYIQSMYEFAKKELCQHHNILYRIGLEWKYCLCKFYDKHHMNNMRWYNRYVYKAVSKLINTINKNI